MKFYMPNIKFQDERGSELHYLVPLDQPHLLARLFDQLDSNIGVMGIASYGLSACSMEQVFVALNEECSDVSTDGKCLQYVGMHVYSMCQSNTVTLYVIIY